MDLWTSPERGRTERIKGGGCTEGKSGADGTCHMESERCALDLALDGLVFSNPDDSVCARHRAAASEAIDTGAPLMEVELANVAMVTGAPLMPLVLMTGTGANEGKV